MYQRYRAPSGSYRVAALIVIAMAALIVIYTVAASFTPCSSAFQYC